MQRRDKDSAEKVKDTEYMLINWSEEKKRAENHSKGSDDLRLGNRR